MRALKIIIISIVLIVFFAGLSGYILLKNSVAPYEGTISLDGISEDIEITFDAKGIPQIWAAGESDAYFALGWLHASERLFQMDMTRRIAQGRLSQVLGDVTLKMDMESRKIGHGRMAKEQISNLSAPNLSRLESYTRGINAFVEETASMPFEFYLLGYDFEPWSIFDCLTILSFQTWYSDALQNRDLLFVEMASQLGVTKAKSTLFDYPQWAPTTVPSQSSNSILPDFKSTIAEALFKDGKIPFLLTNASNSWVTSPQKSISGSSMLASDPHLDTGRIAQFWFYVGIHIKEKNINALGISSAGLPFIIMGHNGHAAWAFTAAGVDVTEFYEEQINPRDSTQYKTEEGWQDFVITPEKILIAGSDPYPMDVWHSRHGPVFYRDKKNKKVFTIDWAGFDADLNQAVSAGFDLVSVSGFKSFRGAVTQFAALDANWTYADKAGNIGYQLGTPIPIRPANGSNVPVKGWENERVWQGYYPLEKAPFAYNPEKGWLASANNKQAGADLGYEILGNFAADRIIRLDKLLSMQEKYSIKDFMQIQGDRVDETLVLWSQKLSMLLRDFGAGGIALSAKLQIWDGFTGIESKETAFLKIFQQVFKKNIFGDELPDSYGRIENIWLLEMMEKDSSDWFDDITTEDQRESRAQILKKSLQEALEIVGDKEWGDFQHFTMQHPFSIVPVLGDVLHLKHGPWPWPGTEGTLNSSFSTYRDEQFKVIVGPSWRFIIDFADTDAARIVIPAGNSGNPMSPHFIDFLELWRSGKYWQVPLSREKVYAAMKSRLVLKKNGSM